MGVKPPGVKEAWSTTSTAKTRCLSIVGPCIPEVCVASRLPEGTFSTAEPNQRFSAPFGKRTEEDWRISSDEGAG